MSSITPNTQQTQGNPATDTPPETRSLRGSRKASVVARDKIRKITSEEEAASDGSSKKSWTPYRRPEANGLNPTDAPSVTRISIDSQNRHVQAFVKLAISRNPSSLSNPLFWEGLLEQITSRISRAKPDALISLTVHNCKTIATRSLERALDTYSARIPVPRELPRRIPFPIEHTTPETYRAWNTSNLIMMGLEFPLLYPEHGILPL